MPIVPIDSLDDPRLDAYRDLRTSKAGRRSGSFVAEGMWLVRRLLESGLTTESLLIDHRRVEELGAGIPDSVDVYVVPDGWSERVVGFRFHRGVVACARRPLRHSVRWLADLDRSGWLIVALADVQDPENVGSVLRNASAFGARAVILGPHCGDPLSRRILRVSMGAPFHLDIVESDDLATDLDTLRSRYGARIAATVLDKEAVPLDTFSCPGRLILVLGNEGHGLPEYWKSRADHLLTIPMTPPTDSLNVAVASGVFMYALSRART